MLQYTVICIILFLAYISYPVHLIFLSFLIVLRRSNLNISNFKRIENLQIVELHTNIVLPRA